VDRVREYAQEGRRATREALEHWAQTLDRPSFEDKLSP
jgi:hypothetical protein